MTIDTVVKLLESGGLYAFSVLVWWELRTMRVEMVSILNRLDERTKK